VNPLSEIEQGMIWAAKHGTLDLESYVAAIDFGISHDAIYAVHEQGRDTIRVTTHHGDGTLELRHGALEFTYIVAPIKFKNGNLRQPSGRLYRKTF
jgi:hypothetical protein